MPKLNDIVIVSAVRTPVGSFNGAFANLPAHELGRTAIKAAIERAGIAASDVEEVILGQVLQAGAGQGPARQASINAGVPVESPAWSLNQLCGSGLRAVALGAQQIAQGDAAIVVAGGQESMSQSPHAANVRSGQKMGDLSFVDTMIKDGLWDAFHGYHMGQTAENIASRWQITRDDQDRFAVASQNKAEAAQKAGRFKDEIAPVTIKGRKGDTVVDADEYVRHGVTLESVSGLRPAFSKEGSVTAANASGINDGAAALVLMSAEEASRRGLKPLARIASWAHAGVEPAIMGTGPIPASRKALEKAGWSVGDLDLVESNEAFAAQSLAVVRELGLDPEKVNVNGGAIAIGHPIGASGARILTTLLHEMKRARREEGPRHPLRRRRHGRGHVRRGRLNERRRQQKSKGESVMNRVAFVTGGTRGIGKAISARLKAAGYKVAAGYAGNEVAAQACADELGVKVVKGNVSSFADCVEAVKSVQAAFGPVDVLVNNAGITRDAMLHRMSEDQWNEVIRVNLASIFNMTRNVIESMRERGFGRIINISSVNGQKGQMGQTNYSAAKAGMIGFTKALAQENAQEGHHGELHRAGLHRHRDGGGGAQDRARPDHRRHTRGPPRHGRRDRPLRRLPRRRGRRLHHRRDAEHQRRAVHQRLGSPPGVRSKNRPYPAQIPD